MHFDGRGATIRVCNESERKKESTKLETTVSRSRAHEVAARQDKKKGLKKKNAWQARNVENSDVQTLITKEVIYIDSL